MQDDKLLRAFINICLFGLPSAFIAGIVFAVFVLEVFA